MGNVLNTAYKVVADVIESEENINIEQGTIHVIDNKLKVHLDGGIKEVSTKSYKVYTALLTQSGTDAPVATVLENTLGGDVVWSREGEGKYMATSTNLYTESKTLILHGVTDSFNSDQGVIPFVIQKDFSDSSIIRVNTFSITSDLEQDGFLYQTPIEIRVYN